MCTAIGGNQVCSTVVMTLQTGWNFLVYRSYGTTLTWYTSIDAVSYTSYDNTGVKVADANAYDCDQFVFGGDIYVAGSALTGVNQVNGFLHSVWQWYANPQADPEFWDALSTYMGTDQTTLQSLCSQNCF